MEAIFKPLMEASYHPDARLILGKRLAVALMLDALDEQLQGQYIVGRFSLADVCWAPYIHALYTAKQGDLVDSRPNVKAWWGYMKSRDSFRVLPNLSDIRARKAKGSSFNG